MRQAVVSVPTSDDSDIALVNRAKAGDESAFGLLFDRHRELVFRFALQMIRNRDEAEDVVQESFVRAFRNIGSYQDRAKFTTWLLRIVTNLCTDRARMVHRRHHLEQQQASEGLIWMTEGDREDPNENLVADGRRQMLREALAELSDAHRQLIIMRDLEEMEYAEIAELLGCSVGGAKLRVLRARRALKDRITPRMEAELT
ncbi:MAG: sigma-70 family RNA polymerase sigma factor [Fimbriimonadaceae bacterium]|nr:sigma-70 family RNA polymerase sigma factor [Fimbriimonadaceae bacterium]